MEPKKTNNEKDFNDYIRKSHIKALEKFKAELERYKETCDPDGWLYEDANTLFTLDNIRLEDGYLKYDYCGKPEQEMIVCLDEETGQYYEESLDGIMDYVKFWRKCLNRAKRYFSMDSDKLDRMADGEEEDENEEEE